jgi:hypothetical protein
MIHIVFQQSDVDTLQEAIALDESLKGEIIEIKDELAVGPIADIYETEGYQRRRDWIKEVLIDSPYTEQLDIIDDKLSCSPVKRKIERRIATGLDMDGAEST